MLKFLPLGQSYQRSFFWRVPLLVFMNKIAWNCSGHTAGIGFDDFDEIEKDNNVGIRLKKMKMMRKKLSRGDIDSEEEPIE